MIVTSNLIQTPKVVTIDQNRWSRSVKFTGHDLLELVVTVDQNTHTSDLLVRGSPATFLHQLTTSTRMEHCQKKILLLGLYGRSIACRIRNVCMSEKFCHAVRATPTDGPAPTPPWGSSGGYLELGFGPRTITESNKASSFKSAHTTPVLPEVQVQPNKLQTQLA